MALPRKRVYFKRHFLNSIFLIFSFLASLNAEMALSLSKDEVQAKVVDTKSLRPSVRNQAFQFFKQNVPNAVDVLIELLQEDRTDIQSDIADVLKFLGPQAKKAVPALIALLGSENISVRASAAVALGEMRPESAAAVPVLMDLLKSPNSEVRADSALALAILGEDAADAVPLLIESLKDKSDDVRINAARALWSKGEKGKAALPSLSKLLDDKSIDVRLNSAVALVRMGLFSKAFPTVLKELNQKKSEDRIKALEGIGHMGPAAGAAIPYLRKTLDDPSQEICQQALIALAKVGGSSPDVVHLLVRAREKGKVDSLRWIFKIMGVPAWPALLQALKASDGGMRVELEEAFYENTEPAVAFFQTVYKEKDPVYRAWAVEKLGALASTFESAAVSVAETLNDPDFSVRWTAYEAIRRLGSKNKAILPSFLENLSSPDVILKYGAVYLIRSGSKESASSAVPVLASLLNDADVNVRYMAALTLYEMGSPDAFQKVAGAIKDPFLISRLNTRPGRALFLDRIEASTPTSISVLQISVKDFFEFYDRDYALIQVPKIKLSQLMEGKINNGLKAGDRLWVWQDDQETEFVCDTLEIPQGELGPFTKVDLHLKEGRTRKTEYALTEKIRLISRYPVSAAQRWKLREATSKEVEFATEVAEKKFGEIARHPRYRQVEDSEPLPVWTTLSTKVVETEKNGVFLLVEFDTNKSIEFLHFHSMVFWKEPEKKTEWRQIAGFDTQGVRPLADVDGDGVPELYGSTEYQAAVLWKIFPQLDTLATQSL